MVSAGEVPINRAAAPGQLVKPGVNPFRLPAVGDPLRPLPVRDVRESVVGHPVFDAQLAHLACQPVMAVQANLQPARQPRGHAHVAEAQFLVDEIEVVMQALAVIGNQICLPGLFVVPWLVGRTGLHGRENTDESGLLTPSGEDLFYPIFPPEIPLADEFDLDTAFGRHLFRALANPVPEWLGELRIVEDPDLALEQKRCQTDLRQRAENQHPIPATQYARNLVRMPLCQ